MIEKYKALRWEGENKKNKLVEEGSEMSLCLGQRVSLGAGEDGPQTPGRMRSAKGTRPWAGQQKSSEPRDKQLNLSLTASELESIKQRAEAVGMRPVHFGRALLLDENRKINSAKKKSAAMLNG